LEITHRHEKGKQHLKNLTTVFDSLPLCLTHSQKLKFICINCEILICEKCIDFNHIKHEITIENNNKIEKIIKNKLGTFKEIKEKKYNEINILSKIKNEKEKEIEEINKSLEVLNFNYQKINNIEVFSEKNKNLILKLHYLNMINVEYKYNQLKRINCNVELLDGKLNLLNYGISFTIKTNSQIKISKIILKTENKGYLNEKQFSIYLKKGLYSDIKNDYQKFNVIEVTKNIDDTLTVILNIDLDINQEYILIIFCTSKIIFSDKKISFEDKNLIINHAYSFLEYDNFNNIYNNRSFIGKIYYY
jgi:hypothetical protein